MPILYNADKNTRKYLVGRDSETRINPMYTEETHNIADKYLYNRLTQSLDMPPVCVENQGVFLENGVWVKKIDRVGQHYYEQNGTKVDITEYGVDIPAGCIQGDPTSEYHTAHDGVAWIFDLDMAKAEVKAAIHNEKNRARDGGVIVNDILFDTDINARISYQDFARKILTNSAYSVSVWKASMGVYVIMDAALFSAIEAAGELLLIAVYEWQNQQETKVDAVATPEELNLVSTSFNP